MLPSNPHEVGRTQPQLLTNQDLDAINTRLLTAGEAIETSRQKLFETRFVASSALQELEQERQIRQRCSDAYKELHIQYGRRVDEMHKMTTKCMSLHKELEESQNTISGYESTKRGFAAEKVQLEDTVKDLEMKRAETAQQIQIVLDRETRARGRIERLEKEIHERVTRDSLALQKVEQLEKEREQMIQEHRAEVNMRFAREGIAEQRISELQKRVEELMQGRVAMSITADHVNPAERSIDEFREKCGTSEQPPQSVSIGPSPPPERSPSLGAAKRGRPAKNGVTPLQQVRLSKRRKCKEAAKAAEEDTIVVQD